MNSNICFFVRNNNDIDNIVPVAWKCAQCDVNVNIIILTHHGYKRDFRILYLSKNKNVKVYHIIDFLNVNSIEKVRIVNRTLKNISPDEVNSPCVWSSYIDNNIFYQNIIAKIFDNGKNCLACFDSVSPFVRNLSKKLNKFEVPVVLLPHGVYPFVNLFISKDMIKPRNSEEIVKNSIFDYVILPNENELKMTCSSYQSNQVKVLGSARFCNEWREIFFISQSVNLGFGRNAKLKVAFFLRDWGYAINWEEVERTFRLITQFSEVHLIVKHHPRSIGQKNLRSKYPFLFIEKSSNITISTDQGSSYPVVEWADIVIECGTGMGVEAIIQNKPLLSLEYLHPNRTIYAEYIKNCDIQTRDQLYEWIAAFLKDKNCIFYDDSREKFLSEMIQNNDSDVLNDYVNYLTSIACSMKNNTQSDNNE